MGDGRGLSTRKLIAGPLELTFTESAGPRILGLSYKGSVNLLASVPQISIPTPFGDYHYIGGHRLWYAPEAMPRSYVPDDEDVTITDIVNGVILDGKTETGTGIRKSIEIHINPDQPQVSLTHMLVNEGLWHVELAPWTITMFRLGGVAVLPFQSEQVDMDDLLPNRHISLWSYSKINDPRLRLEDDFIFVSAKPDLPLFKIGAFNPRGWIAYWNDGILFCKTFNVQPGEMLPDNGCNAEIYCDENFIELESLAPLVKLAPSGSVSQTEVWEIYDSLEQDFLPEKIIDFMK
jgi:hypothetical protein